MSGAAQRRYSLDDYWAIELASPVRHEYIHGAVYAMAGGTPRHNEIAANVQYALRRALDGTDCRPVGADQRIRVSEAEYTYADVSVFRGRIEVAPSPPPDTATNPVLIVEVLSDSTRAYDHGDKRELYRGLPSLRAIWLVEPEEVRVTVWTRTPDGWTSATHTDDATPLPALDHRVRLGELYETTLT